jgi:multidrug efflux pump subunit AcrB
VFGLALFFLFIIQALLHRSWRAATMITLTAISVVAGTGAVLLLSGMPLSPAVWLGGLILIGIVAGQTSQFVASAAGLSGQGLLRQKMLRRIAARQFRPLLAMTFVILSGMMPLLFSAGVADILHPVIIAMTTGLLFSLPVNLFLVPLLYSFFGGKEQSPGP